VKKYLQDSSFFLNLYFLVLIKQKQKKSSAFFVLRFPFAPFFLVCTAFSLLFSCITFSGYSFTASEIIVIGNYPRKPTAVAQTLKTNNRCSPKRKLMFHIYHYKSQFF
jgi:hypothetical protein